MQQDEFEAHPLWAAIDDFLRAMDESEDEAEEDEGPVRDRIRFVAALTRSYSDVDPALFIPAMLDPVKSGWDTAKNQIASQVTVGTLTAAETQVESTMVSLGSWPQPTARGGAAAKANRQFAEYRKATTAAMEALRTKLEEADSAFETSQTEHTQAVEELRSTVATLEKQLEAMTARVTADEARLDTALTTTNESFRESQNQRDKRFAEWLDEQSESLEELAQPRLTALTEMRDEAKTHLQELEDLHARVENVAGKATGAVLARGYSSYAFREFVAGLVAYAIGFGFLVAVGAFLFSVVRKVDPDTDITWQFVALRLGLTVTGIAAAAVAFQLGSRFLHRASINKRVELELRAIGTFLEDVDDEEEVKKAKLAFVNRMFGRAWDEPTSNSKDSVNASAVTKILDSVASLTNRT